MERSWSVYLLRCSDGTLYCGCTNNVDRRIKKHNSGIGAKYTRSRVPVFLECNVGGFTHGEALRLEAMVKRIPRCKKVSFLVEKVDRIVKKP